MSISLDVRGSRKRTKNRIAKRPRKVSSMDIGLIPSASGGWRAICRIRGGCWYWYNVRWSVWSRRIGAFLVILLQPCVRGPRDAVEPAPPRIAVRGDPLRIKVPLELQQRILWRHLDRHNRPEASHSRRRRRGCLKHYLPGWQRWQGISNSPTTWAVNWPGGSGWNHNPMPPWPVESCARALHTDSSCHSFIGCSLRSRRATDLDNAAPALADLGPDR